MRGTSTDAWSHGVATSFDSTTVRSVNRHSRFSDDCGSTAPFCPAFSVPSRYSFSPCASMHSDRSIASGCRNVPETRPYWSNLSCVSVGNVDFAHHLADKLFDDPIETGNPLSLRSVPGI